MTAPKSRPPLAVGERCAVYDNGRRQVGVIGAIDRNNGNIRVDAVQSQQCASWKFGWFHPRQLRRIVKRQRREWTIEVLRGTRTVMAVYDEKVPEHFGYEPVLVREVPRGK